MRQWLWKDTLNVAGQYTAGWSTALLHAFGGVAVIFAICIVIDYIRIRLIISNTLILKTFVIT